MNMQNKSPFFIVGTGRCGTQMLRNILNTNKKIKVLPETFFIPILYKNHGLNEFSYEDFIEVVDNVYGADRIKWIKVILNKANKKYDNFYEELKKYIEKENIKKNIKGYTETFFEFLHGKNILFGDKSPHYGVYAQMIKKIWPDSKLIFLVRDGVDTAYSMKKYPGFVKNINGNLKAKDTAFYKYKDKNKSLPETPITMEKALKYWEQIIIDTKEELDKINKEDVLMVKYENILFKPKEEIKRIVSFLNLNENEKWVKKAISIPRPFPEKHQVSRFDDKKYKEYYSLVEKGMKICGYPYNTNIKRNFNKNIKEIFRCKNYYFNKINLINYLKKIIKFFIHK